LVKRRNFKNFIDKTVICALITFSVLLLPSFIQADNLELRLKPYTTEYTRKKLHTQPWFLNSFLDLKDDLEEATTQGKRFAIIWELAGCSYCRETHLVNFARSDIGEFIQNNYEILQLDLRGSREVIDFDGTKLTERELAKRNNIRFTPTIQFFSDSLNNLESENRSKSMEVSRMPGYFRPQHFLMMFNYVLDKGYEYGDYRSYLKTKQIKTLNRVRK
jgi:thioredoxin-related protein